MQELMPNFVTIFVNNKASKQSNIEYKLKYLYVVCKQVKL